MQVPSAITTGAEPAAVSAACTVSFGEPIVPVLALLPVLATNLASDDRMRNTTGSLTPTLLFTVVDCST